MIEEPLYYLYRHIRLDKNVPLYIGKGTANLKFSTSRSRFKRAYDKNKRRSIIWKRILEKTDYRVEIIFQTTSEELILKKEEEFIKLYGRLDLGTGTLANLTNGGEKGNTRIVTEETRAKMSASSYSRKTRRNLDPRAMKVFAYTVDGDFYKEFGCIKSCEDDTKVKAGNIGQIMKGRGKQKQGKGFVFFAEYQGEKIPRVPHLRSRPVAVFDKHMNKIAEFRTKRDAAKGMGVSGKSVDRSCNFLLPTKKESYNFRYIEI